MRRVLVAKLKSAKGAAVGVVIVALGSAVAITASPAAPRAAALGAAAGATTAPATVTARLLTRSPGTLARGAIVRFPASYGPRTFTDAKHGFSDVILKSGVYPIATADAGKTWRTDGPAYWNRRGDTTAGVTRFDATPPDTYFAWGGPGGGSVVDVTTDGGKRWWQAFLGTVVMAVVPGDTGQLIALTQIPASSTSSTAGATWVYASTDGGHHWHYTTSLGAN